MNEYLDYLYGEPAEDDPRPGAIGPCPHCGYLAQLSRINVHYEGYTWHTYGCLPCGLDKDRWRADRSGLNAATATGTRLPGKVRSVSRIETDDKGRIVGVVKEEWSE